MPAPEDPYILKYLTNQGRTGLSQWKGWHWIEGTLQPAKRSMFYLHFWDLN